MLASSGALLSFDLLLLLAKRSMATLTHLFPYATLPLASSGVNLWFLLEHPHPPSYIPRPSCVPRWCMSGPPSPSIWLCILCMSVPSPFIWLCTCVCQPPSPSPATWLCTPCMSAPPHLNRESLLLGEPSELVGGILSMIVSHMRFSEYTHRYLQ